MPRSTQNDTPIVGFAFSQHPSRIPDLGREQGVKSTGVWGETEKAFCLLKLLCDLGQVICSLASQKNGTYSPGVVLNEVKHEVLTQCPAQTA